MLWLASVDAAERAFSAAGSVLSTSASTHSWRARDRRFAEFAAVSINYGLNCFSGTPLGMVLQERYAGRSLAGRTVFSGMFLETMLQECSVDRSSLGRVYLGVILETMQQERSLD